MRFGQLIATCAKTSNISGVEDEEMLKDIEKYIEIMKKVELRSCISWVKRIFDFKK